MAPYSPSHESTLGSPFKDFEPAVSLDGRTILLAGGVSDLGRDLALRLAEDGANLALIYGRSEFKQAKLVFQQVQSWGVQAGIFELARQQPEDCELVLEEVVERFGKIDLFINARARSRRAAVAEQSAQCDRELLRCALPHLRDGALILHRGAVASRAKGGNITEEAERREFESTLAQAMREKQLHVNFVADETVDSFVHLARRFEDMD